jgi:hypothetical protein
MLDITQRKPLSETGGDSTALQRTARLIGARTRPDKTRSKKTRGKSWLDFAEIVDRHWAMGKRFV